MQIVICDDLKSTIQDLEQLLLSYEKENNLDFHISYFTTPSELYPYLKKTPVDVIFMPNNHCIIITCCNTGTEFFPVCWFKIFLCGC